MPLTNHTAIFGGSYDPPHIGHQITCLWLMTALNAKNVIVAPTYEHCFGKKLTDFKHRVQMCHMMCRYIEALYVDMGINQHEVITTDIEAELPKPNITYNLINKIKTLNAFKNNEIAVVVGSDLVSELHMWSKWDQISKMAKIVAVGRSGFEAAQTPLDVYQYPVELSAVSSSEIRKKIKKGESIIGLVPHNVEKYIRENNLYA